MAELPPKASNRVEVAKVRAGRILDKFLDDVWPSILTRGQYREAIFDYLRPVVLKFATEARALARQRKWSISDVRREVGEFEKVLLNETQEERGQLPDGEVLTLIRDNVVLPAVERALHDSMEWDQHEAELLAIAEADAAQVGTDRPAERSRRRSRHPDQEKWLSKTLPRIRDIVGVCKTQQEACRKLDNAHPSIALPPQCAWSRHGSWAEAFKRDRGAVRTWLSKNCKLLRDYPSNR
jgi:hypothetical protein